MQWIKVQMHGRAILSHSMYNMNMNCVCVWLNAIALNSQAKTNCDWLWNELRFDWAELSIMLRNIMLEHYGAAEKHISILLFMWANVHFVIYIKKKSIHWKMLGRLDWRFGSCFLGLILIAFLINFNSRVSLAQQQQNKCSD